MTLTLLVRGNKKLCFHFKSARVSAHTQDMLQWSEKLQDTTPSNFTITGPGCCRLLKQLPQGDHSNLVYSSLSIHSSNIAQVITTSLSPPKSSPKGVIAESYLWLGCLPFGHWSKQTQHQYAQAFLGQAYVRSPGVSDPAQPAHPEHISHTNTHLSHRSNPLHHSTWLVSLLECPAPLGEDKQIFWFASNLQSTLSMGCRQPSTSRTSTPQGGYPLAQHPASTIVR